MIKSGTVIRPESNANVRMQGNLGSILIRFKPYEIRLNVVLLMVA